jgi:DNA-binding HxlR family transcriptional regulator
MLRHSRVRSDVTQIAFMHHSPVWIGRKKHQAVSCLQARIFLLVLTVMTAQRQCPVTFTSSITGGRWKPKIIWTLLRSEPQRYSALRRACPPISDRILSKELKELESCGLVSRREHAIIPPRTEYSLTALGHTLRPILEAMAEWGDRTQDARP